MTKKQFHHDIRRGLGSCIVEMKNCNDIERYRDDVLWCCRHEMAYDAQCEGTRAWYLFQMIRMYNDWKPFNDALYESALKKIADGGWLFAQAVEVLSLMAGEGYELSMHSLDDVFERLVDKMSRSRNRHKWGTYPEFDNFEFLCSVIIKNVFDNSDAKKEFLIKVIAALGRLCRENERMKDSFEADWFFSVAEDVLGKEVIDVLIESNIDNEDVKRYIENVDRMENDRKEEREEQAQRKTIDADDELELAWKGNRIDPDCLSADKIYYVLKERKDLKQYLPQFIVALWNRQGKNDEIERLVKYYEAEDDDELRNTILSYIFNKSAASFFSEKGIIRLIDDAGIIHQRGQEDVGEYYNTCALDILSYIKSDIVHDYALKLLDEDKCNVYAVHALINNYREGDKERVIELVKSFPIRWNEGYWHEVFYTVRDLYEENAGKDIDMPDELLSYMYHEGLCSMCRDRFVRIMLDKNLMTGIIKEECKYDSNEDIRALMLQSQKDESSNKES